MTHDEEEAEEVRCEQCGRAGCSGDWDECPAGPELPSSYRRPRRITDEEDTE